MKTRILLADDHTLVREGLRSIIEQELGMEVVGQAANGKEVIALATELLPEVIVMDVHMPLMNGIDATREILSRFDTIKVIALSMHRDQNFVTDMFRAGAHAYVLKHCALGELEGAIRCVLAGRKYLSADLTDLVIDGYANRPCQEQSGTQELTPKERNVLQLIAEGKSTKEIADALSVSVSTVETHRTHIMVKTNLHSVAELTRYAIRIGLTEL
jgi:DNA-binding NarL/FixJ family response regulator